MLQDLLQSRGLRRADEVFEEQKGAVTRRCPGAKRPPWITTEGYAQLDLVLIPRRWSSTVAKLWVDHTSPLMTDHFPVIVESA
eukprot:1936740-Alexandrium_andersonii.AAC.1